LLFAKAQVVKKPIFLIGIVRGVSLKSHACVWKTDFGSTIHFHLKQKQGAAKKDTRKTAILCVGINSRLLQIVGDRYEQVSLFHTIASYFEYHR